MTSLTHGFEAERRGRLLRLGNHLDILIQGVDAWNRWRAENPDIRPNLCDIGLSQIYFNEADLSGANLSGANLSEADLRGANLHGANLGVTHLRKADLRRTDLSEANLHWAFLGGAYLSEANLIGANLIEADLYGADFRRANLSEADLRGADLRKTYLIEAQLSEADLSEAHLSGANLNGTNLCRAILERADLSRSDLTGTNLSHAYLRQANFSETNLNRANLDGADLVRAILVETNLVEAILTNCRIYGISAWDMHLERAQQFNLVITPLDQPTITVDNLEVAQFIYLLLNNQKIRDVIDTITSKVVLILGRFTPERKAVLDALRDELRKHNYSPVLFDFEKPANRDFTETLRTLAHLARFIIADLTDPSSIPQELQAIVPDLEVPVQPLLLEAKREYAMFVDFRKYPWVLPVSFYTDLPGLLASLNGTIIDAAEKKVAELALEKAKRLERP